MKTVYNTFHSEGRITLSGIVALLITMFLLTSSVLFTVSSLKKGELQSREYLTQTQHLNTLSSSIAYLSMSVNTFKGGTLNEKHQATRDVKHLSEELLNIATTIRTTSFLDSSYTSNLAKAINQLVKASKQIIEYTGKSNVSHEALIIDFRSVYRIAEFHISTVRDLTIEISEERSRRNQTKVTWFLIVELIAITVIALVILITITGRQKAEENLKSAESSLTDLFDSMPSALFILSKSGQIERVNRAGKSLLDGMEITSPVGKSYKHLVFVENHVHTIEEFMSTPNREELVIRSMYKKRTFHISLFPMTHRDEVVLHIEELTEQEKIAEELRQTQKMNVIGQLAGGIAHDFNNVLGGIINAAELLKNSSYDKEDIELIDLITTASMRASELTRKLLTFSKKDIQKLENIQINEIMDSMKMILRHTLDPKINIELHQEAGNVSIAGDSANLQNIFINLGINAGQAMPNGGTIVFSTKLLAVDELPEMFISDESNQYVQIEVADTGEGIDPDIIDSIFEPFFTTKNHGTGIGLAVSKDTVKQLGGEIRVDSKIGKGTTFTIILPCEECAVEHQDVENYSSIPDIQFSTDSRNTILVIDDEEIIRRSAALLLQKIGYTVLLGANGRDGVELFKKNKESIKCVILDMVMPVMDGKETLLEIRKLSKSIPIVISSGFAHPENYSSIDQNDIHAMLSKPYTLETLQKVLDIEN